METSKLFSLLNSFSAQEKQRFVLFLESPFYNRNDELVKLFHALRPYLTTRNKTKPTPDVIYNKLFGKAKFSSLRFRRLMSDLYKQAERFLQAYHFNQSPVLSGSMLLGSLNAKELNRHYLYSSQQIRQKHAAAKHHESDYFLHQFLIEAEQNNYLERLQSRTEGKNLDNMMDALDKFYLLNKLKSCCAVLHYKQMNSIEVPIRFFDELLLHLQHNPYTDVPAIGLYFQILQTLTEPENETHFTALKKLLQQNEKALLPKTCLEVYMYAINYCIRKINTGNTIYFKEAFELYKQCIKSKIILSNKKLSPWNYKNIITVALRLKEFTWVENFIKKFSSYLPADERENAFSYNLAKLDFERKNYAACLQRLQTVTMNDVFYLLGTKMTQVKALYELNETEALDSLLKSFRLLLKRKKIISQQHRTNYSNFVRYVSLLKQLTDKKKIKLLQTKIEEAKQVVDKGWLKEKAEEMI